MNKYHVKLVHLIRYTNNQFILTSRCIRTTFQKKSIHQELHVDLLDLLLKY